MGNTTSGEPSKPGLTPDPTITSATGGKVAGGPAKSELLQHTAQIITGKHSGIYSLREPRPDNPEVDIVFFHGLQIGEDKDAWWRTWLSEDGSIIWPQWLPAACRILSVQWDAMAATCAADEAMSWHNTAIRIVDMLTAATVGVGSKAPRVLLVGHSMGGLMIKEVVAEALQRKAAPAVPQQGKKAADLVDKLCGFVFFGTPHHGAWAASAAGVTPTVVLKWLGWWATGNCEISNDLMERLKIFDHGTDQLNKKFANVLKNPPLKGVPVHCFAETKSIKVPVVGATHMVVTQASATLDGWPVHLVEADHFGVCKLASKSSLEYVEFEAFVGCNITTGIKLSPMNVIGREDELKKLCEKLQQHEALLVHGSPGYGKTTLVSAACHALCDEGIFDGLYTVDLTGAETSQDADKAGSLKAKVAAQLVNHLVQAKLCDPGCSSDWQTITSWTHAMSKQNKASVIVFDNAEELVRHEPITTANAMLRGMVEDLCLAGCPRVVVISRISNFTILKAPRTPGIMALSHMTVEDGAKLLTKLCGTVSESDAHQIVKACGHSPLELTLVAAALNNPSLELSTQAIIDAGNAAAAVAKANEHMIGGINEFDDELQRLVGLWKLILHPLFKSEAQYYGAACLSMFQGSFTEQGARHVAAALFTTTPSNNQAAAELRSLTSMAVIEVSSSSPVTSSSKVTWYQMHHLHREAAQQLLQQPTATQQREAARKAWVVWTVHLGCRLKQLHQTSQWQQRINEAAASAADIQAMLHVVATDKSITDVSCPQCARDGQPGDPYWTTADQLRQLGQYTSAELLFRHLLDMQMAKQGLDHPDVARALAHLGSLLREQYKLEAAEPLIRDALRIRKAELPSDHPDVAHAFTDLGWLLRDQGMLDEAQFCSKLDEVESQFRSALGIWEKLLAKQDADATLHYAMALNNLGWLLTLHDGQDKQDKLAEAEGLLRNAVEILEAKLKLPADNHDLLGALHSLGTCLSKQRKFEEAERRLRRVLDQCKASMPAHHRQLAHALHSLGSLLHAQGKLAEAEPLVQRALTIRKAQLPANHRSVVESRELLKIIQSAKQPTPACSSAAVANIGMDDNALADYTEVKVSFQATLEGDHKLWMKLRLDKALKDVLEEIPNVLEVQVKSRPGSVELATLVRAVMHKNRTDDNIRVLEHQMRHALKMVALMKNNPAYEATVQYVLPDGKPACPVNLDVNVSGENVKNTHHVDEERYFNAACARLVPKHKIWHAGKLVLHVMNRRELAAVFDILEEPQICITGHGVYYTGHLPLLTQDSPGVQKRQPVVVVLSKFYNKEDGELAPHMGPGASINMTRDALADWSPELMVALGVAWGTRCKDQDHRGDQSLCDVLVSSHIAGLHFNMANTSTFVMERVQPFVPKCAAQVKTHCIPMQFPANVGPTDEKSPGKVHPVHFGVIVSCGDLMKMSREQRTQWILDARQAHSSLFASTVHKLVGGEMEGMGIVQACRWQQPQTCDVLVIKSICDWGDEKKHDRVQNEAARNSAYFLQYILSQAGGLTGLLPAAAAPAIPAKAAGQAG